MIQRQLGLNSGRAAIFVNHYRAFLRGMARPRLRALVLQISCVLNLLTALEVTGLNWTVVSVVSPLLAAMGTRLFGSARRYRAAYVTGGL